MPEQKRCKGCDELKPSSAFYTRVKNGRVYLRSICKPCHLAYNAAHISGSAGTRNWRGEEFRKYNRERMALYRRGPAGPRLYERVRRYQKANPERVHAWKAVERAVRAGRLTRPERCGCGRDSRVTAHHDDYTRPLDVLWLCMACHHARHEWLASQEAA